MTGMKMSREGLVLLSMSEGTRLKVYEDSGGYKTIGVGHLLTDEELDSGLIHGGISWREGITMEKCLDILAFDVRLAEQTINRFVNPELNQNQFDALVCFVFNIGGRAFTSSTLLKRINANQFADVPHQMSRWNKVKGKVVRGLTLRREVEAELFCKEIEYVFNTSVSDTLSWFRENVE